MGTPRHASGTQPDAAAPGNGRIVSRLLAATLGRRQPAWSHAICRDTEARLCRGLLQPREVTFRMASARGRGNTSATRGEASGGTATEGNSIASSKTDFAPSGGGAVEQDPRRVGSETGRDRRHFEATVSGLRGDARISFGLSYDSAGGQAGHAPELDGAGPEDGYSCPGSLCANFETGPSRGGSGGYRTVEQWTGGGTNQPAQNAEATNVWPRRGRVASRSPAARGGLRRSELAPNLSQSRFKCSKTACIPKFYDL